MNRKSEFLVLLAEVSDKMPPITTLWLRSLVLSVPGLVGIVEKRVSWIAFLAASLFSAWWAYSAYHEAFLEGDRNNENV